MQSCHKVEKNRSDNSQLAISDITSGNTVAVSASSNSEQPSHVQKQSQEHVKSQSKQMRSSKQKPRADVKQNRTPATPDVSTCETVPREVHSAVLPVVDGSLQGVHKQHKG